ncbi:hypothetical protein NX722_23510 [Endozoicomonas gorgoniicola]|uniref:Portal protein n=1 Tax=Endozoicomonas gorgoniicola TaxID=1234144 RepID=A0ABT3N1M7_9GAMM|nr:hypothetical protein [Endozoicomonas gorgoniicola]MCW7555535.1 hypothetical protein [Endozoicomonas gorgoniicola]
MKTDDKTWHKRIQASRSRREAREAMWQHYASLHSEGKDAWHGEVKDSKVELPQGDIVKVSLIFRNLEQTMGYLEIEDIGVTARAASMSRQLDNMDTHRESVVEQGVYNSLYSSGMVNGPERIDRIKLDALICGHGISYSWWRTEEEEVEQDQIAVMVEKDGRFVPKLGDDGFPVFEPVTTKETVFEGVNDERISPMEFLFDSGATAIGESRWHGFERVTRLAVLKADDRYNLPDDIEPSSFRIKTLAGEMEEGSEYYQEDSVKVIVVYDRDTRELITFMESASPTDQDKPINSDGEKTTLTRIRADQYPVRFVHPDDSPFNSFIPIPGQDDPFGVSQVEHIRIPALEADILRTRRSNLARDQKRLMLYDKNKIEETDVNNALRSKNTTEAVGMDVQDDADISRIFKEVQTANLPDALLQFANQPADDVRENSGVSEVPFGGAETATESENQQRIGQARVNRKRSKLFKFLNNLARTHFAFLARFTPDGQTMRVTLANGEEKILEYGRTAFDGKFVIDVGPGGGPTQISPVRQKMLIEAAGMLGDRVGPEASLILTREILTQMDIRNVNGIMEAARRHVIPPEQPLQPQQGSIPSPDAINNGQTIRSAINPME